MTADGGTLRLVLRLLYDDSEAIHRLITNTHVPQSIRSEWWLVMMESAQTAAALARYLVYVSQDLGAADA